MAQEKIQKKSKQNEKNNSNASTLIFFLKGSMRYFVLAIIFSLLVYAIEMIMPKIIAVTVDSLVGEKAVESEFVFFINLFGGVDHLKNNLYIVAVVVGVMGVASALFRFFNNYLLTIGSEVFVKSMRDKLFFKIQRLAYSWHMENHTGDIIQRCTTDINTIRQFVSEQLISLVRIVLVAVLSIYFMATINLTLTLVAVCFIPVVVLYSFFFHSKISKQFLKCDESEGVLSSIAQENLTGVRVVRAFGRERYEKDKFEKQNLEYTNLWMKVCKWLSCFWGSNDLIMGLEIFLIIVLGTTICVNGNLTEGNFIAFVAYNAFMVWPVRQLGRVISEMSKAGVALQRIRYINDEETEKDKPTVLTADMHGDICFNHVTFGYTKDKPVLNDISFEVKGGTVLGILGGTGSGKSTLVLLLNRLYPLEKGCGNITIGGVDIADMSAEQLRKNTGTVLQEPFLYTRTIAQNVAITQQEVDLEQVRQACSVAALDQSVSEFADGYDTIVGERGVTLSGGQKQRTAIARMLLQKTPIMVFDDSLSAVDTETDMKIRNALSKNFGGSTVILISHRVTTIMNADKIIVLDKGRVAEQGNHRELMELNGTYRKIYDMQMTIPKEIEEELKNGKKD